MATPAQQLQNIPTLLYPVTHVQVINRELLQPNDYNPNVVLKQNLQLLQQSIRMNGWTMPIVIRPDYGIIDGFHRWMLSGEEPLHSELQGLVPVVMVDHEDPDQDVYGTITHNRARGTHLLGPMEKIIQRLLDSGKTIEEISKQLGMKKEEIYRLSGFTRKDFLQIMVKGKEYSKAFVMAKIN